MKHAIKIVRNLAATLIVLGSLAGEAVGAVVITFAEEPGGTQVNVSGSLDTNGLSFGSAFSSSFLNMQNNSELWFTGAPGSYRFASHGQAVAPWHSLNQTSMTFTFVSGSYFGFNGANGFNNIMLPDGYVSESQISSSFLINGISLTDINPQSGTILTLGNGDTISISVPEPSTAVLVGFGMFSLMPRRLKQRKVEQE